MVPSLAWFPEDSPTAHKGVEPPPHEHEPGFPDALLPMSAHTRRDGPGCRSTERSAVSGSGQAPGPGFTPDPRVTAPRPQFRSMGRPASSDAAKASLALAFDQTFVGTSPSAISLVEHLVEFGVEPHLPDFYRAAAGAGGLGSPLQRLLA
jgi:hypothetical protein